VLLDGRPGLMPLVPRTHFFSAIHAMLILSWPGLSAWASG
jgi:hypothetical protein